MGIFAFALCAFRVRWFQVQDCITGQSLGRLQLDGMGRGGVVCSLHGLCMASVCTCLIMRLKHYFSPFNPFCDGAVKCLFLESGVQTHLIMWHIWCADMSNDLTMILLTRADGGYQRLDAYLRIQFILQVEFNDFMESALVVLFQCLWWFQSMKRGARGTGIMAAQWP